MIRTTPVEVGNPSYDWNSPYKYNCTWYVYGRCNENGLPYPCWFEGHGNDGYGSYTDAKEWVNNYRSPWIPYPMKTYPDYIPVANDIVVYDGEFGHVQFMETDKTYSEYKSGDPNSFNVGTFKKTANIIGFLHLPYPSVDPVDRNNLVDQIQTSDTALRIRKGPSLESEVVGHIQIGYYNVLHTEKADGYTWYEIAEDRWCADITTTFLPADDDIIKEIEKAFNSLKSQVGELTNKNAELKGKLKEIHTISDVKD